MKMIVRLRQLIGSSSPVGLSVLALVLFAGTVCAQSTTTAPAAASVPENPQAGAAQKPAAAPAAAEGIKIGAYDVRTEFEVGYRTSPGIKGNDRMYRSQVNLFEGIRLLNSHLSMRSAPGTGLFDRLELSMNNWGDPYNTLRLNMGRMDLYDLRANYRNLNYENYISTIANPFLEQGNLFPQHNLNVNYRMADFELRLFPTHKIVPFVGYSRNSSTGPGFTTTENTGNQFLARTEWNYTSDEYRGGIQLNYSLFNVTLEQGYRYLRNNTSVVDAGQSAGNEGTRPVLGQVIRETSLNRGNHGFTKMPVSKVLAKFTPFQNLSMVGRYVYSIGSTEANLGEIRTGNFVSLENFLAYSTGADFLTGRAKRPNHNGSFLIEFSPASRITLTDNVDTINYHISGESLLSTLYMNATSLLGPSTATNPRIDDLLHTEFTYNQVRNQAEAELYLGAGLSARVGHRYTFVEATSDISQKDPSSSFTRNAGIVGLVYRPGRWLRIGVDYENNSTTRPLTRTESMTFDRVNVDWRIGSWHGLSFNGRVWFRNDRDHATDIDLEGRNRNYSGELSFQPTERFGLSVDFTKSNLFSDMLLVIPQNFQTARSVFDERVTAFGGRMDLGIYKGNRLELGYRGVINRGDYPLEFHQPYASVWIPLAGGLAFKPTWQYYGYSQTLFGFENYQTHLFTFALVFAK